MHTSQKDMQNLIEILENLNEDSKVIKNMQNLIEVTGNLQVIIGANEKKRVATYSLVKSREKFENDIEKVALDVDEIIEIFEKSPKKALEKNCLERIEKDTEVFKKHKEDLKKILGEFNEADKDFEKAIEALKK